MYCLTMLFLEAFWQFVTLTQIFWKTFYVTVYTKSIEIHTIYYYCSIFRSSDGLETMKLFVIANSIVMLTTLVYPHVQAVFEIVSDMIYGSDVLYVDWIDYVNLLTQFGWVRNSAAVYWMSSFCISKVLNIFKVTKGQISETLLF